MKESEVFHPVFGTDTFFASAEGYNKFNAVLNLEIRDNKEQYFQGNWLSSWPTKPLGHFPPCPFPKWKLKGGKGCAAFQLDDAGWNIVTSLCCMKCQNYYALVFSWREKIPFETRFVFLCDFFCHLTYDTFSKTKKDCWLFNPNLITFKTAWPLGHTIWRATERGICFCSFRST